MTFIAPYAVELREREVPEPREGQLLVRTLYSGISAGTELLAYRGEIDPQLPLDSLISALSARFSYPFHYGYSCVGRVERSPAHVNSVDEGQVVFAFHPHQDLFIVDAADTVALGPVDPRLGTLFPLVETALQITLDAGEVLEQPVVVIGLGAVGILTAALLLRAGARVLAAEPKPWRREAAAEFGISTVLPDNLERSVMATTSDAGVPLVIEVSGDPAALGAALPLLAQEGTALVASWYGARPVTLPLGGEFHRRRLTIRSTQVSTIPTRLAGTWTRDRRRATAARLLGELPLQALATHVFPFDDAAAGYAALARGEPGLLHAAFTYRSSGESRSSSS
ncbi:MAG TPA: zinc-binding alcohol dehydrogenase [Pseudonocardiaceae bacterium]|nr:zinc-binding alcohol dehydrogenase [Pseudonocardiaceae bacterium]